MDSFNQKVILLTFFSYYYAMLLKKKLKDQCILKAVPRSLSSSCGTCALIDKSLFELAKEICFDGIESAFFCTENGYKEMLWKK